MFHIGYLITFGGFIITFTDLVAARFCEGGHRCLPPKECCAQGCCYLFAPPSAPRSPPPATDHVLNLFFINHWYFWCVVLAIILALLCACSIWKKRRQLCGWGSPGLHSQSEGDSAGSCYAPPQYSRCSSFHHAPPPYTEVTSKPDLYPLVFTCNGDSGKGGANYLMVQYFRNYIVRPAGGSLSATSTVDSLSSSFICTANEANTLVPPPYSRAASPDLPVTLQGYTIPRSASQQACTLDNTNFNRSNSVPPSGQINSNGNALSSGSSGGVGSMITANGTSQHQQTQHHNQQQQQQNMYSNQPGIRTPTSGTPTQTATNGNGTNYQMRLSESANFHNLLRSSNSLANNININNSKNNNNNNNNHNLNNSNNINNNRNSRNVNPVQMSQSEGQFRYNENLSNSNSINGLQYYSSNGGSLNSASGDMITTNINKNMNNCYKNNQQQQSQNQQQQSTANIDSTSSSQQYINNNNNQNNHQQQYQPQYHHHQGSNVYNSCSSIGGISITVPTAQDTDRDYQELNTLRNNLDSCSQILQQQQQKLNGTDGSFISEESPVIEIMKRFDIIRSYTTSNTGSAVSSLANMSSPSSPPRATSPTNEVRDLLDQIRKLQNGTSSSLDLEQGNSIDGACKMSTSLTSGNGVVTTTAVPQSKRPSTLQSQKKKFFSTKGNKSSYTPIASNSNTKTARSPVGCNSILGRGRGRRGWISRSAPTTPGTTLPPNHLGDDSPLLNEHDEENV